jgi:CRP/FNR family transcriptional regulator, cyclic AMP receptor protein
MVHKRDFWGLLSRDDQVALQATARPRTFRPGMALCTEGEPSTHVFILTSGWVGVTTVTHDGQEILEALRSPGDIVGEMAVAFCGYRTATMRAIGVVQALVIGIDQFEDFLDAHKGAARAHRWAMAERQRMAFEAHRSHIVASGPQRLAGLLIDLAARQAEASGNAASIGISLSQEDMASLIGASRSTVTRALQEWRSRSIVATEQRRITILDREQLLRIAGRAA